VHTGLPYKERWDAERLWFYKSMNPQIHKSIEIVITRTFQFFSFLGAEI
jgi:hypothetical protein